ncbi:MAG: FCD domain-containing protein [Alphaproteobacteria bacterium]|nr:FCD domain-containing protein [Alphaproteobacteria bacterium]
MTQTIPPLPGTAGNEPGREPGDGSAVDNLVQQIKGYIQSNRLTVGDTLPSERELGEKFAAARNTVREAVRILKAYGVVDVRPKIGAVIVNRHMDAVLDLFSFQLSISRETFLDIQGFRRLIEVGSADAIFSAVNDADIARFRKLNEEILDAPSKVEAAERDFGFHAALLELADNQTVLNVYTTMKPIIVKLMETGKESHGLQGTYDTHTRILDALEKRDRLGFQYWMSNHLDHGLGFIDRSVDAQHPEETAPEA